MWKVIVPQLEVYNKIVYIKFLAKHLAISLSKIMIIAISLLLIKNNGE